MIYVEFLFFCNHKKIKNTKMTDMQYRNLGPTGIKVSVISFGNWLNSDSQQAKQRTCDCVKKAWDMGINYFDTAEGYGFGQGERQMGQALRRLNIPRHHYVVSTKIFWGHQQNLPNLRGLSRKHVIQGMKNSLKNLQLDYVDVVFCHRPDYQTPMEETCRAFDWLIRKGYAFYWGTSQWNADDITEAHMICDRYNLVKPVVEQPEYSLFHRQKIQFGFRHLFEEKKLGTTVWSPLANGVLTGKYNQGIPEGSRFDSNPRLKGLYDKYFNEQIRQQTISSLKQFEELAKQLGGSMAQLAMAWVIHNPDVSTAITGASSTSQLEDTVQSLKILKKLTPQIESRIQKIFNTAPKGKVDMPKALTHKSRRFHILGYS